ncbi:MULTISPECIES: undecaprenyl-diphosphate phosphatase [unclassified Ruminococcus]|uniref:undecaprenyl-diphosphate phosphatase n=1 Tax=unclassified Ruminococcus TaxID=2608920 RepID=UPI00210A1882|nr:MULTISPECIES: undecaprenyl-diphosphate phosphatase [unclassified Ruminococcus]MCQ4022902.1 undecaprenyl-diphosphate phosphatase [Ruminococcus sp. zg-924]MCQ4115282.1 undecaprenyl-diphosphate phosphatase [Ruminococcus sp. zg-921]
MTVLDAIIQGAVQGLTEFLPVSSSGHLAISQHILGVTDSNLFFNVMLHVGTLFAVLAVYRKTVVDLIKGFVSLLSDIAKKRFSYKNMTYQQNMVVMLVIGLLPLFLLFLPVPGSGGISAKDLAEIWSGNTGYFFIVGAALLFTSILLSVGIAADRQMKLKERKLRHSDETRASRRSHSSKGVGRHRLKAGDAALIGVAQLFAAIFPGLSRSGSTLAMGQLCGLNKQTALDYSFVLGIPSILAAAILEGKDAIASGAVQNIEILPLIIGVAVSAVVGFFAILLFKWMLAKDRMYIFVIYTAIAAAAVIIISIIELQMGTNIFTGEQLQFV